MSTLPQNREETLERWLQIFDAAEQLEDVGRAVDDQVEAVRAAELAVLEEMAPAVAAAFDRIDLPVAPIMVTRAIRKKGRFLGHYTKFEYETVRHKILVIGTTPWNLGRITEFAIAISEHGECLVLSERPLASAPPEGLHIGIPTTAEGFRARIEEIAAYNIDAVRRTGVEPELVIHAAEQALQRALEQIEQRHDEAKRRSGKVGL